MSELAKRILRYYRLGFYRPEHLDRLAAMGAITAEEHTQMLQER